MTLIQIVDSDDGQTLLFLKGNFGVNDVKKIIRLIKKLKGSEREVNDLLVGLKIANFTVKQPFVTRVEF